ncbi:hypothetical protein A3F66_00050 [candidate division TM6 bacterium RIFCSPHIGHO2_12_FULL_32_22]|nr:MAG: hypothetical protein A3F66_00050 [candidate division TM6 bacterium RIFCSPHIGHO2_12_FULL_32_22]
MKKLIILLLTVTAVNGIPEFKEYTLKNGLKVVVQPSPNTPDVSIKLYYHVGSKDEKESEKGLAHLLEHMIFKGTQKLSETDIDLAASKLSGWCNANTYYDRTCYEFNLPKRHWQEALPILADCMTNCRFQDDHLNSEFKAVIQELKMGRDNPGHPMFFRIMNNIFPDHPYHFPVIGYKQDIWNVTGKDLHKFYKKHYLPNNAILVVVGDVDSEEVSTLSEKLFGHIKANFDYKKKKTFLNSDITSTSTKIYRDIQTPTVWLSFLIPGLNAKQVHLIDCIKTALAGDQFARLNKILVEEKQLVHAIQIYEVVLFEYGLFIIAFDPKNIDNINEIQSIIFSELKKLETENLTSFEIKKIVNQLKSFNYELLQDNKTKAALIGEYYLAAKDYIYPFQCFELKKENLNQEIKKFISTYLREAIAHQVIILPIPESEKENWKKIQEEGDAEDLEILNQRIRESEVEKPKYSNNIYPKELEKIETKRPEEFILSNGIKVFFVEDKISPKVDLLLVLKASPEYEPADKPEIYALLTDSMFRGTKNKNYNDIVNLLTKNAINFVVDKNKFSISCLTKKLTKACKLLNEILTEPEFQEEDINKIKDQMKNNIKNFWDTPQSISEYLLNNAIYKDHIKKATCPTSEQIDNYNKEELLNLYKQFITPDKATIFVSGDIEVDKLKEILESIAKWFGNKIEESNCDDISETKADTVHHKIDRDQTHLTIATKSISYKDENFHNLLIASHILSSGMSSKLFQIRQQTGLFYTVSGSFLKDVTETAGMFIIKTIVSKDNVDKSKEIFLNLINNFADTITEADLKRAQDAILDSLAKKYVTRVSTINNIYNLYINNLGWDFYRDLTDKVKNTTLADLKKSVKEFFKDKEFVTITVGR